ncbi:MAG: molybdopterin oxidoreductase [Betaproteobacteria bacterium RIFCSPHIGHO2_12_FULL_69_13]|nr:MAG: molybdopterin oxidoreductase [Betaproteobacteria bacterium RIFCSPHIGHO2_12_FULL_69_13]OGA68620.1 MAG: molybdopterin oxidoreductase [Betaproteobacteria bacterium RIFCSPLOWO2_12_FULL_68_20]
MGEKRKIPVFCYQCVSGPDLMKVEVEDGIALRVESNYDIRGEHPGGGRVCVKAYGLVQKTYNPSRIRQPMKRTNPKKGRGENPGFAPISWDEALEIVAARLRGIRERGLRDESGFPRLAVTTGGGGTPVQYMGTFPAFMAAWGPVDQGYGAGQGVKCYHSEHLYGELWHRAFIVSPDTPYVNYIINCGNNVEASGGVVGVWREADARVRGAKRVQVEPHLSITGAMSAEWVPIKPKTDAAFLFALVHRILCERNWTEVCDVPFLKQRTNSPYLVGPNGWFLRDPESKRPLLWDSADGAAKPFDANVGDPALTGTFQVAGVELGPDGEIIRHNAAQAQPAFQKLLDHVAPYAPEWAERECDVPAATIRRIADEYLAHACVGQTIEIEGMRLPFRPVAVMLGKTVNNGWGGYHACWARTVLAVLVGALEVPGGTLGTAVKLVRPAASRTGSCLPGPDGFMRYDFNPTSREAWESKPHIRNAFRTLVPLVSNSPWSPALGPAHLPWLFQKQQPDHWPKQTTPEVWFCYRTNPAISSWNAPEVAERLAEFPFIVAFAYTEDETNHFADVLLPEATDLESLQLIRIGSTKFTEQFWKHEGWAIRQPAAAKTLDCVDMTDISTELARRTGILQEYNEAINRGAAGMGLRGKGFDYALDPAKPHALEEIWDAVARAASHDLSDGKEVHGIDWFKEHGYMLAPFPQLDWYLHPAMTRQNLRYELPYQERIVRHGRELAHRLHETGIEWWDTQLKEYEFLPSYERFPDIWINYAREVGRDPAEYPLWALTARSMQYSWGANVGLPLISEVAANIAGHRGVIINRATARSLGIAEGDAVAIESVAGVTRGRAVLREGIRPDTVLMIGQFDHWKTPYAKDLKVPSLNTLTSLALSLTDSTGSGSDLARVKLYRE